MDLREFLKRDIPARYYVTLAIMEVVAILGWTFWVDRTMPCRVLHWIIGGVCPM